MVEILGVKFKNTGKAYYFDPKGVQAKNGDSVLAETTHGVEMGKVVIPNRMVEEAELVSPLKPVIRIATEADFKQVEANKEKEKEAFDLATQKIAEHKLEMKLVDVEYTFDRGKILFYFTADGRVDFRDLVKSLASVFKTRIELRQIGVRDEARQLGSYGICGRFLCCSGFLNDFHPVSIKMAKEQELSLNPTKISGVCGRLMCCLQYEQNVYEDMLQRLPRKGEKVHTPKGDGVVNDIATLKGEVRVKFQEPGEESFQFETYPVEEISPLHKKGWGGPRPEEKEEEEVAALEWEEEHVPALTEEETSVESKEEKQPAEEEKNHPHHHNRRRRNRNRNHKKPQNNNGEEKPKQKENGGNVTNGGYHGGY